MSENERQLLGSARKGDVAAFEELIAPFRTGVYNLMWKTCNDEFEASMLAQDVFVRVFEALISGDFGGGLSYHVYRTAGEVSRIAARNSKMIS